MIRVAGFDGLNQPGEGPVDRCGDSQLFPLVRQGAVNVRDLGSFLLEHILEHRGNISGGSGAYRLGFLHRIGIGKMDLLGPGNCLSFLNRRLQNSPGTRVPGELAVLETGNGGEGVDPGVDQELSPDHSAYVVGGIRLGLAAAEGCDNLLHLFAGRAGSLSNEGFSLPGMAYFPVVEEGGSLSGSASEGSFDPDPVGDYVQIPQTVLEGEHEGTIREKPRSRCRSGIGIIGFHRDHHQIGGSNLVRGGDDSRAEMVCPAQPFDRDSLAPDDISLVGMYFQEPDFLSGLVEEPCEETPDCPGPDDCDSQKSSIFVSFFI